MYTISQKLTFQQHWHERRVHKNYHGNKYETVVENSHGTIVPKLEKHSANYETDKRVHEQFE